MYSNDEVVAALIDFDDGVRSWDVVIRPVNGGPPSTCHEDLAQQDTKYPTTGVHQLPVGHDPGDEPHLARLDSRCDAANPNFQRVWQSQDLGPSVNGKYMIEITAYNGGQPFSCGLFTGCQTLPVEPHSLYQSGSNPARWREVWVVNGVSEPTGVTNSLQSGEQQDHRRLGAQPRARRLLHGPGEGRGREVEWRGGRPRQRHQL